ncbi:MAG: membrane protease YdiL (CAAX protease family) [Pseudohongiellaceae bacterium]|jgi:membrane protease YdiL (CAAX protease family)
MNQAVLGLLLPTLGGALLWRFAVAGRIQRLSEEATAEHGLGLFVPALLAVHLLPLPLLTLMGSDPKDVGLTTSLIVQAGCNGISVLGLLAVGSRLPGGLASLGLRRHKGPNPLVIALASWLMILPLLALAKVVNEELLIAAGQTNLVQDHMLRFVDEGTINAIWVWSAMVLILPLCEEILFRGALYGGLRRRLPAPVAIFASGLLFGLLHDPSVILPVTVLGMLLAWLYERTGSLLVPYLTHLLQNGITLTILTYLPEELT